VTIMSSWFQHITVVRHRGYKKARDRRRKKRYQPIKIWLSSFTCTSLERKKSNEVYIKMFWKAINDSDYLHREMHQ
jgi:hypothetical protein